MHWLISEHELLCHNKAIKVLNQLPLDITQFQHNKMQFKIALIKYLLTFFYYVDEFLAFK
jgi:hypothetical protein